MKRNLPITQKEVDYSANTNILSTACPKGIITYVNQDFLDISGFTLDELIKKNHNIVRHPDVPEAVFEQMWGTIKSGRSWMGVVKNRCKNGDHYWVDAYVTPIERDGKIAEYQSIRRKPNREHVARSEQLFQDINANKKWQPKFVLKLLTKLRLLTFIPIAMTLLTAVLASLGASNTWLAVPVIVAVLSGIAQLVTTRPLSQTIDLAYKIIQNPVARYVYTGRHDDVGQLLLALRALEAETSGLIGRIADSSESLLTNATDLMGLAGSSSKGIEKQFVETEQVAGAVQEMTNSIHQVAQNAQQSAQAMSSSHQQIREGQAMLTNTVDLLKSLNKELESTTLVVNDVQESSKAIVAVLDVINSVSEQTNLLALNAAIEAARAGDAGRGFAVVADEVRQLASRTRTSTDEIQQIIEKLQGQSQKAVTAMGRGHEQAEHCLQRGGDTLTLLDDVCTTLSGINDSSLRIAKAMDEQSSAADLISGSVAVIQDLSQQNLAADADKNAAMSNMSGTTKDLKILVQNFWSKPRNMQ